MAGSGVRAVAIDDGWRELESGNWEAAANAFDRVLAGDPVEARALEGRAWAAWWLDDAATLFRAREDAYRAYRDLDDRVASARAAIWLGCDHHEIRGDHAVANGWYQRAQRLLEGLPQTSEHGWLAFHQGAYALELASDATSARSRAAEALDIARSLGLHDLEFVALALDGLALVTEGDVVAGMRLLDEAGVAATSGDVLDRVAVNWTLCYVVYACERARDFERLEQWCSKMQDVATRFGFAAGVGICRVRYGGALVLQGSWKEAEHELQRSRSIFAEIRPLAVAESEARLGELRRRQGRIGEAVTLLEGALPHPLAVLSLASIALDEGDPSRAIECLTDLLESTPERSSTQLIDVHGLLAVAHAHLGQLPEARASAAWLQAVALSHPDGSVAALAAMAKGVVATVEADPASARRSLAEAVTLFDRAGLPYESARARTVLADVLEQLDRPEAAATARDSAARQLEGLGVPSPTASPTDGARRGPRNEVPGLTPRESEVLALLSRGLTDRAIAEELTISPHTVHRHVANMLTKLGVSSRAAAAAHGARHGLGG